MAVHTNKQIMTITIFLVLVSIILVFWVIEIVVCAKLGKKTETYNNLDDFLAKIEKKNYFCRVMK